MASVYLPTTFNLAPIYQSNGVGYTMKLTAAPNGANYSMRLPLVPRLGYLYYDGLSSLSWQQAATPAYTTPFTVTLLDNTMQSISAIQNGTGDATIYFRTTSNGANWIAGIDQSDAGNFKIARNSTLGSPSDKLIISDTITNITNNLKISNSYFMPSTYGVAGKFLRSQGDGTLYWGDIATTPTFDSVTIETNSSSAGYSLNIEQLGSGNASMQFTQGGRYFSSGLSSDGKYKIAATGNIDINTIMSFSPTEIKALTKLSTSAYSFPISDGTVGYYLKTDGAGQLYWGVSSSTGGPPFFTICDVILTDTTQTGLLNVVQNGTGTSSLTFTRATAPSLYSTGIDTDNIFKISRSQALATTPKLTISDTGTTITDKLTINNYSLPLSDGLPDQIIKTNGSGVLSWTTGGGGSSGPPFTVITDININNATTTGLLNVNQAGVGTASQTFSRATALSPFSQGIDSDNIFKISRSQELGTTPKLTISATGTTITDKLTINNYALPLTDGTPSQILQTNGDGTTGWATVGLPTNTITKGGQSGPISLGTTDNTDIDILQNSVSQLSIKSTGRINLGNSGTNNDIYLNGGLKFLYEENNTGASNVDLQVDDYMMVILNIGTTTVTLPAATGAGGRSFIIGKGFAGGTLRVYPNSVADTIEGQLYVELSAQYAHLKVISNNQNLWYCI